MIKSHILLALNRELRKKESDYLAQIDGIRTELANDSKSSAGDKYETSREMAQQEIEQLSMRLQEVKRQFNLLQSLPSNPTNDTVEVGSLVVTNNGNYFIGIPFGTVEMDGATIYAIGPTAPLAQLLLKKQAGSSFQLSGKEIVIQTIE